MSMLLFATMTLCLPLLFVSCSDDDLDAGSYIQTVSDVRGRLDYNAQVEKWCIAVSEPGTIDEVLTYYPEEMPKEFRKQNMKVVFSGQVYELNTDVYPHEKIGGWKWFFVKFTSLKEDK